jgi:hypothetical protein
MRRRNAWNHSRQEVIQMVIRILAISTAAMLALVLAFPLVALAGNKQLMSEKMAAQDCKRNIVESIIGVKVKSESRTGLTDEASYNIKQKTAGLVKGIRVQKMIYDPAKDIAFCVSYIDLDEIRNILGERIAYRNLRLFGFGFGTMTPESRPPLMALRAALLNAYDELAALVVGQKVSGSSQTENFVLTKDKSKSVVCAAIYGAYIPDPDLDNPKRGWGWDTDGNAFVRLNLDLRKVHDIMGKTLVYKGNGSLIEVIGRGSPTDELGGAQPTNATEIRNLDVPVAPQTVSAPAPPQPEQQISPQPAPMASPQTIPVAAPQPAPEPPPQAAQEAPPQSGGETVPGAFPPK